MILFTLWMLLFPLAARVEQIAATHWLAIEVTPKRLKTEGAFTTIVYLAVGGVLLYAGLSD